MYFIEDFQDLIGKQIAYIDLETDTDCIIGTTDGGILAFYIDAESPPSIYKGSQAKYFILNRTELVEELVKSGMQIMQDYTNMVNEHKKQKEKEKKKIELMKKQKEYEQYLKLKEQFETK